MKNAYYALIRKEVVLESQCKEAPGLTEASMPLDDYENDEWQDYLEDSCHIDFHIDGNRKGAFHR